MSCSKMYKNIKVSSPSKTVHHGQATAVNATLSAGGGGGSSVGDFLSQQWKESCTILDDMENFEPVTYERMPTGSPAFRNHSLSGSWPNAAAAASAPINSPSLSCSSEFDSSWSEFDPESESSLFSSSVMLQPFAPALELRRRSITVFVSTNHPDSCARIAQNPIQLLQHHNNKVLVVEVTVEVFADFEFVERGLRHICPTHRSQTRPDADVAFFEIFQASTLSTIVLLHFHIYSVAVVVDAGSHTIPYRLATSASLTLKLLLLLLLIIIGRSLRCLLLAAGRSFIVPPVVIIVTRFRSCCRCGVGIELLLLVTNHWVVIIVIVVMTPDNKIRVIRVFEFDVAAIVLSTTTVMLVMVMVVVMVDMVFRITIKTRGDSFNRLYWCC
ncbi:hypothetical protein AGLY_012715 [Aphis glycines]|uniref:Uncharacterized protein n=1 Tax=Aphis glycines TaxID=307491 RepID=A0A6G0T9Q9_APHGL|nr:hypothetical protein AGLY_012715 [Aphis glycines]